MSLLDAACCIALFRAEPGATAVGELIARGDASISVINRAEVIDRLARQGARTLEVIADLDMLAIESREVSASIADQAGALRAKHYHRTRSPLSMSDCIAAATASQLDLELASSDQFLADLASSIGVPVIAIANSRGVPPAAS